MKYYIYIGLILITVTACSQKRNTNTYFINFENAEHLTTESPVICGGINVGKINSLKLDNNSHIIVEIEVDKSVQAREGYQFALVWFDSFGKRAIELIPAGFGEYLKSFDSVDGIVIKKEPIQQLDSIGYMIASDSIFKVKK